MPTKQGDVSLLHDPVAQHLLQSKGPAHLARRHAPRRPHRVPLERRGTRDGDRDGCPQNKGAHEWL